MLLCSWNYPGKSTGVGSYSLLLGIFLTQGSNLSLLHFRQILNHLSHQGDDSYKNYLASVMCILIQKRKVPSPLTHQWRCIGNGVIGHEWLARQSLDTSVLARGIYTRQSFKQPGWKLTRQQEESPQGLLCPSCSHLSATISSGLGARSSSI